MFVSRNHSLCQRRCSVLRKWLAVRGTNIYYQESSLNHPLQLGFPIASLYVVHPSFETFSLTDHHHVFASTPPAVVLFRRDGSRTNPAEYNGGCYVEYDTRLRSKSRTRSIGRKQSDEMSL